MTDASGQPRANLRIGPGEKTRTVTLRLPSGLYQSINDLAADDGRSLNSKIVQLLRQATTDTKRGKANG
jgi:hypothetical protein